MLRFLFSVLTIEFIHATAILELKRGLRQSVERQRLHFEFYTSGKCTQPPKPRFNFRTATAAWKESIKYQH